MPVIAKVGFVAFPSVGPAGPHPEGGLRQGEGPALIESPAELRSQGTGTALSHHGGVIQARGLQMWLIVGHGPGHVVPATFIRHHHRKRRPHPAKNRQSQTSPLLSHLFPSVFFTSKFLSFRRSNGS